MVVFAVFVERCMWVKGWCALLVIAGGCILCTECSVHGSDARRAMEAMDVCIGRADASIRQAKKAIEEVKRQKERLRVGGMVQQVQTTGGFFSGLRGVIGRLFGRR
jgi:hypothetical protein